MDVKLPKLGEGADSGVVVNVFVKEGDVVAKGQAIIELENEKAVASIPTTADGIVAKIHVKPGDKINVGQRLVSLNESGKPSAEPASAAKRAPAPTAPEPEEALVEEEAEIEEPEPVSKSAVASVASPSIRRMARELGIDLSKVRGSEPGGRIVIGDVRAYIQRLIKIAVRHASSTTGAPAKPVADQIDFSQWGPVTKKPLTPLRQVILRRMSESWNAVPRVTQFDEADFTQLNALRKTFAPKYEKQGIRLTLTPLVLKALVETLKKHPIFNSSLDEAANEIVLKDYFHIGIAVDTEQGLIVPVIRDVDKKSILDLSKELEELAKRARDRKVSGEELKGGTFTISNQGAIGGAHFTPIVNKPEVAILGLGRGAMKPIARDDKIEIRMMTPLALSYDHRVIDGGEAARFIVDLVGALQDFREATVGI
ncbi:MAG TPA: 2-oxo acid dehydrogenase subunit E2 [Candidatus Saccharimonadales bacterium]|nr:2-oxo acid dehydrogenase subunit E2 [Candidatus Saccharimonadales bacterium]